MVRGWLIVVGLAGCRGFFNTPPVPPDAPPAIDGPAGSIRYVQSQLVSDNATYTQAQFPLAQQAGNTNVVVVSWTVGSLISLDDGANVYSVAIGPMATAQIHQSIFVANAIQGGTDKITATFDSTTLMRVAVIEYAGAAAVDQVMGMGGPAGMAPATGSLATTAGNDTLVAAAFSDPQLGATGIQGFTPRVSDTELVVGDMVAPATGTYSADVMSSSNGAWIMQLVALRAR